MEGLIKNYRLARGQRNPGDPFPKSRRLVMEYQRNAQGEIIREFPSLPMGWSLIEIEKVK